MGSACGCGAKPQAHPPVPPRIFLSEAFSRQKLLESLTAEEQLDQPRILEWWELLRAGKLDDLETKSNLDEIRQKVLRGVPMRFLTSAWKAFSHAAESWRPGAYARLVASASDEVRETIAKDLERTFPNHPYFDAAGRETLLRVLSAYAAAYPPIGYVQGLNFIAGFILATTQEEEHAFWILVRLLNHMGMKDFFVDLTPGLKLNRDLFERLLEKHLPQLFQHFQLHEIRPDYYATKWLLSMFTYSVPFDCAVAIWGIVFTDGIECLIVAGLGLLKLLQKRLLRCGSTEEIKALLDELRSTLPGFTGKDVVQTAIQLRVRHDDMMQFRQRWLEEHPREAEVLARSFEFDPGRTAECGALPAPVPVPEPEVIVQVSPRRPLPPGEVEPLDVPQEHSPRPPLDHGLPDAAELPDTRLALDVADRRPCREERAGTPRTEHIILSVERLPDWEDSLGTTHQEASPAGTEGRRSQGGWSLDGDKEAPKLRKRFEKQLNEERKRQERSSSPRCGRALSRDRRDRAGSGTPGEGRSRFDRSSSRDRAAQDRDRSRGCSLDRRALAKRPSQEPKEPGLRDLDETAIRLAVERTVAPGGAANDLGLSVCSHASVETADLAEAPPPDAARAPAVFPCDAARSPRPAQTPPLDLTEQCALDLAPAVGPPAGLPKRATSSGGPPSGPERARDGAAPSSARGAGREPAPAPVQLPTPQASPSRQAAWAIDSPTDSPKHPIPGLHRVRQHEPDSEPSDASHSVSDCVAREDTGASLVPSDAVSVRSHERPSHSMGPIPEERSGPRPAPRNLHTMANAESKGWTRAAACG